MIKTYQDKPFFVVHPIDIDGGVTSHEWRTSESRHSLIKIGQGVASGAFTVKLQKCTAADGTGATDIAFNYRAEATQDTDILGALTEATSSGVSPLGTTTNTFMVIEQDHDELGEDYDFLRLVFTCTGSNFVSADVTLSKMEYMNDTDRTMLA